MPTNREYALGRSDRETRRLMLQHRLYAPISKRLLTAAGIARGMRVLDVGSGAGDFAMLAADLVGLDGAVVGCDLDAGILETARSRATESGRHNVEFVAGDARALGDLGPFDAVVGRLVLMHVPDPVELVRALVARVRDGGVVAFEELDDTYPPTTIPATGLSRRLAQWMHSPPGAGLADTRMGSKLFRTFVDAGLPEPQLSMEAPIGGGRDWPGYEWNAELIRSLLPALERRMGVDPAQVDVDTLAARMRDEVVANRGVHVLPMHVGAWARKGATPASDRVR